MSQPIELLAQDNSVVQTINFLGAGRLQGSDTEVSEYGEDKWTLNDHLSLTYGGRLTSQTLGRDIAFAPRAGIAYSMLRGKFVARGGAGIVYGHVPLLAADYSANQDREITYTTGPYAGETINLQNVYRFGESTAYSSTLADPNSSSRTFTWNIEGETTLWKNIDFKFGYFETHTVDLFVVNPIPPLPMSGMTTGFLALEDSGSSHYRQAQGIIRYRPNDRAEINVSYTWSRARGDLNTLADEFVPVPVPVIQPNAYGVESSDVPNRVLAWGYVTIPGKLVVSPVADLHSGFPYSNFDVEQNYVGIPNSLRFPIYFSLDVKLYRDFMIRLPFGDRTKRRRVRLGVYSLDVTNRQNPHDVFSNIDSPIFGEFAGFQRRFTGLAIDLGQ